MDNLVEKSDAMRKMALQCPENLLRVLASLIRRGNASHIIIRNGDQVMVDVPVTVGFIGAALAPWFAFFGGMVFLASTLSLEIQRPPED